MKFAHLTTQPMIARIRKNGIHCGRGRRGRGVYAIPLLYTERISVSETEQILVSRPQSSGTLWRWLSRLAHRHHHAAAVVFRTGPEHWPANLYLQITPSIGLDWTTRLPATGLIIAETDLQLVHKILREGAATSLRVSVSGTRVLGILLHLLQDAGLKPWDRFDESIEIVFPSRVEPGLIDRIVPLYRTSNQFKERRQKH